MHLHHNGPLVTQIDHSEQEGITVRVVDVVAIVCNIVKVVNDMFVIFQVFCYKESYFQCPLTQN